jgi:hypothetical protein
VIRCLVEAGVANAVDNSSRTALFYVAERVNFLIAQILLQCGAKPGLKGHDSISPLYVAAGIEAGRCCQTPS